MIENERDTCEACGTIFEKRNVPHKQAIQDPWGNLKGMEFKCPICDFTWVIEKGEDDED